MVALDNPAAQGQRRISRIRLGLDRLTLVGAITLAAVALVLGTIMVNGFSENGFRLGSQIGWRFTSFVFFAVLAAGPVGRLTAHILPAARILEGRTHDLIWGFCASYGVYLLAVLLPNAIHLSTGALLFVLCRALVIAVMALAAAPLRLPYMGAPLIGVRVRRSLLGTAIVYFWLCYSLMALERISGPHRPDAYYNAILLLMIIGLLLRFADRWITAVEDGVKTV